MYVCNCIGLTRSQLLEKIGSNTEFLPFIKDLGFDIKNDKYCGKCFKEILEEVWRNNASSSDRL